ncbi:MarR family transcriptional regulator [Neobacillus sp. MM2021_6]|uniref:MarR family winged helix-turn-helix transcriptional regulator n=1 Tax=Bacillaceae TaxID=186817 RepID=UPI00140C71FA|nr:MULTISPECIES: MarR family transcriptional regulator [Bacillaceae]MBO0959328.1 MarR family transcriptional regulator [Neobacillus sp. MM2021_6]NHC19723.1 MarR family transcriptional regulator [Bacillus sp. MM2020_4]
MVDKANFIRESIDLLQSYLMKSLQKHSEERGVTIPQARVIGEVFAHKKISIKHLSQNLKMTQSTVSDIVERLTTKGFLVKTPNPKDKRSVEISLSNELKEGINEDISEIANKSILASLNLLNSKEQEAVVEGMRLLVSAVKEKMEEEGMDNHEFFDVLYFPEKTK